MACDLVDKICFRTAVSLSLFVIHLNNYHAFKLPSAPLTTVWLIQIFTCFSHLCASEMVANEVTFPTQKLRIHAVHADHWLGWVHRQHHLL